MMPRGEWTAQKDGRNTRRKTGSKGHFIDKGELLDVITALHDRGLGSITIARLLGYHYRSVSEYMRMMGLEHQTRGRVADAIVKHLPDDLELRVRKIKIKCDILDAKQRVIDGHDTATVTCINVDLSGLQALNTPADGEVASASV